MRKLFILVIMLLTILTIETSAQQDKSGKVGIGYSGDLSPRSNSLGMTFFLSDLFTIEPQLGFMSIDVEDNSGTAWRIGLGFIYRLKNFVVAPYLGIRAQDNILSGGGESYSDLIMSFVFGGEYFVSEWFSVSAEMKLNYIQTDDEYSPTYDISDASIFETEQALNIRIYLN